MASVASDRRVVICYIDPDYEEATWKDSDDVEHTFVKYEKYPKLKFDPWFFPAPLFFGRNVQEATSWKDVEGAWTVILCWQAGDQKFDTYGKMWGVCGEASKLLCHATQQEQTAHVVYVNIGNVAPGGSCDKSVHILQSFGMHRGCQPDAHFWHGYHVRGMVPSKYHSNWHVEAPWYECKDIVCTDNDGRGDPWCNWLEFDLEGYLAVLNPETPPGYETVLQRLSKLRFSVEDCKERIRLSGTIVAKHYDNLRDLAVAYDRAQEWRKALEAYQESFEVAMRRFKDKDDFRTWTPRLSLARAHVKLSEYQQAKELLLYFVPEASRYENTGHVQFDQAMELLDEIQALEAVQRAEEKETEASASAESPPSPPAVVENADGTCVICMDAEAQMCPQTCGHLSMCADCAPQVSICPICRIEIDVTSLVRVYKS